MRLPERQTRGLALVNMTPMIDIVLQLIIFFLLSNHLAQQETQLTLDLPKAETGALPQADESRQVMISVLPEGRILLSGERVAPEELERRIKFESSQTKGDVEVRIRADRHVPFQVIEPILLACASAGVWKVTFAVVHDRGS